MTPVEISLALLDLISRLQVQVYRSTRSHDWSDMVGIMNRIGELRDVLDSLVTKEKSMSTMQAGEDLAAKGATAPRVSLDDIRANIRSEYYVMANEAVGGGVPLDAALSLLTVCFLVTQNGYVVMGKSAPASAENFDAEKGRTFAKDDAMRQLWPLMGYALKEKLAERFLATID